MVWSGNGGDHVWSDGTNWNGTAGPIANISLTFDGAGGTSTNDFPSDPSNPITFSGLTFDSTASSFTLQGNSITLTGDIVNNSSSPQTINLPITLGSDPNFNAASGDLLVGGNISGNEGIVVEGSGNVVLSGQNSYTGDTTVLGSLIINGAGAFSVGGSLTIGAAPSPGAIFSIPGRGSSAIVGSRNSVCLASRFNGSGDGDSCRNKFGEYVPAATFTPETPVAIPARSPRRKLRLP